MSYFPLRLACLFLFAACGGGGGDGGIELPELDPSGTHTTYVFSSLDIPEDSTASDALAQDVDGDGRVENGLGTILGILANPPVNLTFQGTIDEQIASGGIVVLASVQATNLLDAAGVGLFTYLGENPSPAPCDGAGDTVCGKHLGGTGSFDVSASSPGNSVIVGDIAAGQFSGELGSATFSLQLSDEGEPIDLTLIGARAEVQVNADGLSSGRLAGAISVESLENDLLPEIHQVMVASIGTDCGNIAFTLFDTDMNCEISFEEFSDSGLIKTFVAPDVDMLDADGNLNPNSDGTDDSISAGVGFTAVAGSFTVD